MRSSLHALRFASVQADLAALWYWMVNNRHARVFGSREINPRSIVGGGKPLLTSHGSRSPPNVSQPALRNLSTRFLCAAYGLGAGDVLPLAPRSLNELRGSAREARCAREVLARISEFFGDRLHQVLLRTAELTRRCAAPEFRGRAVATPSQPTGFAPGPTAEGCGSCAHAQPHGERTTVCLRADFRWRPAKWVRPQWPACERWQAGLKDSDLAKGGA